MLRTKALFWATEQAGLFTTMYIQLEKTRGGQLMYTAKKVYVAIVNLGNTLM